MRESPPSRQPPRPGGTLVVERKRRIIRTPSPAGQPAKPAIAAKPVRETRPLREEAQPQRRLRSGVVLPSLTEEEKASREKAIAAAAHREAEERARAEADAVREAEEQQRREGEKEARRSREAEQAEKRRAEELLRQRSEAAARRVAPPAPVIVEEERAQQPSRTRPSQRRQGRKLTVAQALQEDEVRRQSLAALRRRQQKKKAPRDEDAAPTRPRDVIIPESIEVSELAQRMARKPKDIIRFLMTQSIAARAQDQLDADTAQLVAEEFGHKVKRIAEADVEEAIHSAPDAPEQMRARPPVVSVMGHVDHGKTSLLAALCKRAMTREAGGITQAIGASSLKTASGRSITFLDTPGHEAFSAMRRRGAAATDIAVLVIAADDGVMPQTEEALAHIREAGVPLVAAITKIDLPAANLDKARQEMARHNIIPEEMGGDVLTVPLSAKSGEGLDALEEAILLQADLLDLKANPDRPAHGAIIESRLDKGTGPVASVLIQQGQLQRGDVFVAGDQWGKARIMTSWLGEPVQTALPGDAVFLSGLNGLPGPGDAFDVVENEARAREIAEYRQRQSRSKTMPASTPASLETMFSSLEQEEQVKLPVLLKAGSQGALAALVQSVAAIGDESGEIEVIHQGVGEVNRSDLELAASGNAFVLGFGAAINAKLRQQAKQMGVRVENYDVIYEALDLLRDELQALRQPEVIESELGKAEILQIFALSSGEQAYGCRVAGGKLKARAQIRVKRDEELVGEGRIASLKRFQENANEVESGQECGLTLSGLENLQPGDVLECYVQS